MDRIPSENIFVISTLVAGGLFLFAPAPGMRYLTLQKLVHAINRDFLSLKIDIFQLKNFDIFRRGGSNEYPQSMFWSKNKKNRYTPAYPSFAI